MAYDFYEESFNQDEFGTNHRAVSLITERTGDGVGTMVLFTTNADGETVEDTEVQFSSVQMAQIGRMFLAAAKVAGNLQFTEVEDHRADKARDVFGEMFAEAAE